VLQQLEEGEQSRCGSGHASIEAASRTKTDRKER
jgi:hypothetical protein